MNVQTRNSIHSVFHCIYESIRSGCACRDSKRACIEKPFGSDIIRPLYVMIRSRKTDDKFALTHEYYYY